MKIYPRIDTETSAANMNNEKSVELQSPPSNLDKLDIESQTPKAESTKSKLRVCCKLFFCGNYKERWRSIF